MFSIGMYPVKRAFNWSLNHCRHGVYMASLCVRTFVSTKEGPVKEKIGHFEDKHEVDIEANRAPEQHIIDLTQKLITSITTGDFETYSKLVDPHLTAFEPVARGHLVEGLKFHEFYFDNVLSKRTTPINTSILSRHVHMLGDDAACICYVRLQQSMNSAGIASTSQSEETRVWHKKSGRWVSVHLHRSDV